MPMRRPSPRLGTSPCLNVRSLRVFFIGGGGNLIIRYGTVMQATPSHGRHGLHGFVGAVPFAPMQMRGLMPRTNILPCAKAGLAKNFSPSGERASSLNSRAASTAMSVPLWVMSTNWPQRQGSLQ